MIELAKFAKMSHKYSSHAKDKNQDEVVEVFEKLGWLVTVLSFAGAGVTDIHVAKIFKNIFERYFWIDIKTETGKLSPKQLEFFKRHPGKCFIIRNTYQVEVFDRWVADHLYLDDGAKPLFMIDL